MFKFPKGLHWSWIYLTDTFVYSVELAASIQPQPLNPNPQTPDPLLYRLDASGLHDSHHFGVRASSIVCDTYNADFPLFLQLLKGR